MQGLCLFHVKYCKVISLLWNVRVKFDDVAYLSSSERGLMICPCKKRQVYNQFLLKITLA